MNKISNCIHSYFIRNLSENGMAKSFLIASYFHVKEF